MNKKQKQHQMIVPGHGLAVNVIGNAKEDVSYALKVWKQKVKTSGVLEAVKNRKEFEKPSVTKRQNHIRACYFQQIQTMRDKF